MTSNGISLSVVIPTLNRPELARRALSSVASQHRTDVEAILVDDGSTVPYDVEGILPRDRLVTIRNASTRGAAAARNRGIGAARGRWITFLDDDDEWRKDFVSKTTERLKGLEEHPVFCWCSIANKLYTDSGKEDGERIRLYQVDESDVLKLYSEALSIGTSFGLTVSRRCVESVGLFDTSYGLIEDTEFLFRLLAGGCKPMIVPDVLVNIHHRHDRERLTSTWRHGVRIAEIRRLLVQYERFLDEFPSIRAGLRAYMDSLRKEYDELHGAD